MINKKIMIGIILSLLMSFITGYSQVSGGAVTVNLANQNPDPVNPGNFVYVNVKISNPGDEPVEDAKISFEGNEYFSLAPGADRVKNLGTLPPFSTDSSSSYSIAKFKVYVAPNTPIGLNSLTFSIDSTNSDFNVDLDLLVQDENPDVDVKSFSIDPTESGKTNTLDLELENNNNIDMKDVVVTLKTDEIENNVVSIANKSNQQRIRNFKSGESINLPFEISISPDAVAKPYTIPVEVEFEDTIGNTYTKNFSGSVRVFSEPQLSVQVDSQTIYSQGNGRITLALANPGTSAIKGVQVELLESEAYTILDGSKQYIGDMNPDDFQTLQSDIYLNDEEGPLEVKVTYLDSYNNKIEENLELDLTKFSEEQLQQFNLSETTQGGGIFSYIIGLILIVVAFVLGRKYGFKKAKKKFQKQ